MPLSELYNAVDPQGVVLNANIFGDRGYPGGDPFGSVSEQFPSAHRFVKTFISPSYSVQGGGNGVTSIDDPTYLGFSLRFDILSPLFNGAILTPSWRPPFIPDNGAADSALSPSIDINGPSQTPVKPQGESAVAYLEAIGEITRANYLRAFIQGINEVNNVRPYYWQTIDGLADAWNKSFQMKDPYSGAAEGEGIAIGCLEALDLKITALFNLYKAAVYDVRYTRTILPKNLMYFNVYVDIHEIRKFKVFKNWLERGSLYNQQDSTLKLINENTATITFKFSDCVWDIIESGKIFDNVTNAGGNAMSVTGMKWRYNRIEMESQFPGYGSALIDDSNLQPRGLGGRLNTNPSGIDKKIVDNAADSIETNISNAITRVKKNTANAIERKAKSLIQGAALGNVFGIGNQFLSAIRNPAILLNAVAGAAVQSGLFNNATQNTAANTKLGDSAFAGQIPNEPAPLDPNNLFGPAPSGPPPLKPTNVFR